MYFVVNFRRSNRQLISVEEFEDRDAAYGALTSAERRHRGRPDIEVVLLSADDRESMERTHSRYFAPSDKILSGI